MWIEQFVYFTLYSITAQDRILLVMFYFLVFICLYWVYLSYCKLFIHLKRNALVLIKFRAAYYSKK